jgi:uncharacterized protein
MLSPASQRQLEALLTDFEQKESTQIALLTVPSLKGDSLEDFSIRVAEAWQIGQAQADNGAILLIAKADRKIRIEVGYGLEGRLTDLLCRENHSQCDRPALQEGGRVRAGDRGGHLPP